MLSECTEWECKLLYDCSHRTWLNCRLVTTKRSERTLKYIYVYISRHYAGGPVGPAAKVTLRAVHQLYGSNATIISTAIKWNYLRHLRLHRFLIATSGTIRHLGTRSYMGWHMFLKVWVYVCVRHLARVFKQDQRRRSCQDICLVLTSAFWGNLCKIGFPAPACTEPIEPDRTEPIGPDRTGYAIRMSCRVVSCCVVVGVSSQ